METHNCSRETGYPRGILSRRLSPASPSKQAGHHQELIFPVHYQGLVRTSPVTGGVQFDAVRGLTLSQKPVDHGPSAGWRIDHHQVPGFRRLGPGSYGPQYVPRHQRRLHGEPPDVSVEEFAPGLGEIPLHSSFTIRASDSGLEYLRRCTGKSRHISLRELLKGGLSAGVTSP